MTACKISLRIILNSYSFIREQILAIGLSIVEAHKFPEAQECFPLFNDEHVVSNGRTDAADFFELPSAQLIPLADITRFRIIGALPPRNMRKCPPVLQFVCVNPLIRWIIDVAHTVFRPDRPPSDCTDYETIEQIFFWVMMTVREIQS